MVNVTVSNVDYSTATLLNGFTYLTPCCVSVQPSQAIYPMGSQVPLTVQTYNCSSQAAVPNQSVTIWISSAGTVRTNAATTGVSGSTTVNFVPLPTETGVYQVAAALANQSEPPAQASFTIVGMSMSPSVIAPVLTPNVSFTNTIVLSNLTSVALTGIAATVTGSHPDVQVQVSTPPTLAGDSTNLLTIVTLAPNNAAAQDQFSVELTTAQGTVNTLAVNATVIPVTAQLTVIPSSLFATMVQGGQTLVTFAVVNTGGLATGPVQVELPSISWLASVTAQPLPSIAPGQTNQVTLALTPSASLALGAYTGSLVLSSTNASASVPFQFDCISSLTGDLQVTVEDELSIYGAGSPNVSGATVSVTDFLTGSNVVTAMTGSSGIVLFTNLPSAYYTVAVTAPDHGSYNTTLLLAANETNDLTVMLNLDLVDYTWVVTPTTVSDHYQFTLETTFQSEVPWPVVTVSPGSVDLCSVSGGTNQVDLVITNSGLIAAQGLSLNFGSHPDWNIVPLVNSLGDLAPQSSLTVPVLITQTGATSGVPNNITAQLNYSVVTPGYTFTNIVPLYFFDADPSQCSATVANSAPAATVSGGGGGGGTGGGGSSGGSLQPTVQYPSYSLSTPQSGLVELQLQIQQSAVVARNAFAASLQLVNNSGAAVNNLSVTITVYFYFVTIVNRFF